MWRGWKIREYLSRSSTDGRRQKIGKEEDPGRHKPAEHEKLSRNKTCNQGTGKTEEAEG